MALGQGSPTSGNDQKDGPSCWEIRFVWSPGVLLVDAGADLLCELLACNSDLRGDLNDLMLCRRVYDNVLPIVSPLPQSALAEAGSCELASSVTFHATAT